MKSGNSCLYFLQQLFNSFLVLSGIAIISLGVYLWYQIKVFSFIEIVFFALGGIQVLVGLLMFSSKRATIRINIYILILGLIFILQLTATILGFYFQGQIINRAVEVQSDSAESAAVLRNLITDNVNITMYSTLGCLGIQVACLIFTSLYKDSLQNNNENYNLMLNEQTGYNILKIKRRIISLEETQQLQKDNAKAKTEAKRQEMYTNNPDFYEYKKKQENEGSSLQGKRKK